LASDVAGQNGFQRRPAANLIRVDTGSPPESASNQNFKSPFRFDRIGP